MNLRKKIGMYLLIIVFISIISLYCSSIYQYFDIYSAITANPIELIKSIISNGIPITGTVVLMIIIIGIIIYLRVVNKNTFKKDKREFKYSNSGVYGTAALLNENQIEGYAKIDTPKNAKGTILGQLDETGKKLINTDLKSRLNKHIAIYGASGAGKSRCYARPFIIQCVKRRESVIVTDPKGELYESTAQYLKDNGYIVKVFDLVHPELSDGWACLKELRGQELRAQIFSDVIIKNTGGDGKDVWDQSEMSLLKALILRVERGRDYAAEGTQDIGTAYQLIQDPEGEAHLDKIFGQRVESGIKLDMNESVCVGPYMTFKQASDNMRGNIITGLATRMQVFQNDVIRKITATDDIDLTLPAKKPCAFFCIMSDQHTTLNFLSTLFFTFAFIDQVEFADLQPSKKCPVPVNYLLDEFPNIGEIPDFDKKIATVRSRDINISIIFQSIGQLQNRYPNNVWSGILGNCDTHIMLGCNDEDTAKFISNRSGETTVKVGTVQHPKHETIFTLRHQHSSGDGKRKIFNADEILRLPNNKEIIIFRGKDVWETYKYDYSLHPEAKKFHDISVLDKPPIYDVDGRIEYNLKEKENLMRYEIEHGLHKEEDNSKKKNEDKSPILIQEGHDIIIEDSIEFDSIELSNDIDIEDVEIENINDTKTEEKKDNNIETSKTVSKKPDEKLTQFANKSDIEIGKTVKKPTY